MLKIISLIMLIIGCGKTNSKPKSTEPTEELKQKVQLYENLIVTKLNGEFPFSNTCDSLLFAGLLEASIPGTINILEAEVEPGKWLRKPLKYGECYPANSKSSISRDMLVGLYWYLWVNKDLDAAIRLMDYARANNFIMGEGDPSRISLMPLLTSLLGDLIYQLSNKQINYSSERNATIGLPDSVWFPAGLVGYEAHLQVWLILLSGELNGYISDTQLDRLKEHSSRVPWNILYQAAYIKWTTGDFRLVEEQLLNSPFFPNDKLPSRANYCTDYVFMHEANPIDYNPCPIDPSFRPWAHPLGIELPIIYNLIIKE
jgi:hypothetical protein